MTRSGGRRTGRRPAPHGAASRVLVIAPPDDLHAMVVGKVLDRRGIDWAPVDLGGLPRGGAVGVSLDSRRAPDAFIRPAKGELLRLRDVGAVWWRRPQPIAVEGLASAARRAFAEREWRDATLGLWRMLPVRWVNDPVATDLAALKPWQLAIAGEMGLTIPRTLVTSDPREARAFLSRERQAVRKTLHGDRVAWQPTRRVGPADRRRLGAIRQAPIILQERVPGVDLRVTVVGRRVFPVEIDARRSACPDDCRVDMEGSRVGPASLPPELTRRLLRMARGMGLVYAAFDLRRRRNGEHVFLEVNPAGQWLGFELASGLPITDAMATLLARAARRR